MSALNEQVGGGHYKDMAIQPIEFCQRNRLGYAESLAIKYLCRHGKKNGKQDLEKAIHCINLLIELEYPEEDYYKTEWQKFYEYFDREPPK